MFENIDSAIRRTTGFIVIALLAAMTFSTLLGVFYRYVLSDALTWPEELARYAMVWVTGLGSGLALRYGDHVAVEFIVQRLPDSGGRWVILGGRLLVLFFLVLMVIFGADMTGRVSHQESAALEISMSIPNLAIPVGGALMIYHLLVLMVGPEDGTSHRPELPTT